MEAKSFITVSFILNIILLGIFGYLLYSGFFDSWTFGSDVPSRFCAEEVDGETILKYCDDSTLNDLSVVE